MDYNLFQKTIIGKKGKKVRRWYYWYIDTRGIQRQKVCKDCANKAEAIAFVAALPPLRRDAKTVREIAQDMYLPDSEHVKRRAALGKSVLPLTMRESRTYLEDIIARWGGFDIREVDVRKVGLYLMGVERSGSWKKRYIAVFTEVFSEAAWHGVNVQCPAFPHFVKTPGKSDIFSSEELKKLFVVENFAGRAVDAETAYLFFLVSVFAGLRIGEARGLRARQFLLEKSALVIDGFIRADGTRTNFNKKGSDADRKMRIVMLPENVTDAVRKYMEARGKNGDDFVFTADGKPLRREFLETIFKSALKKSGINTEGRKLTPHSLRFTYVTKMRRTLPVDTVRKLVGHTDNAMTEYYTRASLEDGLAGIANTKQAVEHLFD